jgi:hypothetical protein
MLLFGIHIKSGREIMGQIYPGGTTGGAHRPATILFLCGTAS